ncbi:7905_t:CDS:2, partial [Diversispora eburnea]
SVPFGCAAKWYILQYPLLKNTRLKSQSHLNTSQLIKKQIIKLCHIEGAVDFLEWEYGNTCQHLCGGIGEYISSCSNYNLANNLRNGNDMHHCSVH